MAKKKKIVVDLDLPKDDPTQRNFLIILFLSIMLGTASGLFWITNSGFLPTANGEPMFTNLACSTITGDQAFNGPGTPTYAMNESCSILKDNPEVVVWEETEGWENVERAGASFDMPGIDRNFVDGVVITQPVTVTCTLSAPEPTPYTVAIRDKYKMTIEYNQGVAGEPGDDCSLFVEDLEPGERYEFGFWVDEREQVLSNVKFRFEAQYYDGIPDNMNNKSLWLGPTLGDTQLRPMIFLNFFGLTFFLYIFPASYYAERVALKRNEKEDKFPDFLRDLAEYWKGGLSMTVAVQTLATSEYGALNDEVRKMSSQLSWGVKFGDVINIFAERVGTPLVKRAISLISEADRAGGKISDILITAANDSREIKFLEGERQRAIGSYIAVIWTSYGVFLGVIVVLAKVFIPAIADSNSGGGDGGDSGGQNIGNMQIRAIDPLFFLTIFYYGVTMQAMGNGAMAGLMATGRITSGFKHSGMMIVLAILVFNLIAFSPDLIGVTVLDGLNQSAGPYSPTRLNWV
ncbi:MAG: type II secretion system F family protein [Candidatus Thermoplasmatota archaeon]|nr:type II secretion system F family protein [Candidatus Thermoplasmatota archaeon]MEC8078898.1 type II secretion system F family protein [Candidatus Thermoplasmatota archaeon]MEC8625889.1 type II secretion system F family protein [Candidatus Thermoplasmatota archaeon]MEC8779608.1 type II secretion system F family protein [Candidatus Thermoplasmatota archaeon]MEC9204234.1 type II secretion system F family protein [Candidatus Thermoplasmatota archaeon]